MQMTGACILMECLKREGVEVIFGFPGGQILDTYDELSRHPQLRHILVRHEQGAAHAADGYARATGKVGVCFVTSGPGATNAVTGIATAYADSIPMVIICGQVGTQLIGNDAFQEVDIVGITRPCVKHNFLVKDIKTLAWTIRQAFYLARSGRPGPVLIDFPKDIQKGKTEFVWPETVSLRSYNPTYNPNVNQLRRAMELLRDAKKPLLMVGGGVILANAHDAICTLAREMQLPVIGSLMGLGGFPGSDPLWLGMVGMHGTYAANMAISECDVLLAVGTRFDDRITGRIADFAPHARIIHVDIDPTSIRKSVNVEVPIVGDSRIAVEGLLGLLHSGKYQKDWTGAHDAWIGQTHAWKKEHPLTWTPGDALKPQQVLEAVNRLCKGRAIITTEVGQHQMWVSMFCAFDNPRTLITSGGLGTMGYGLPAAIGAQVGKPGTLVVDIAGDGSIQMNIQELMTAVESRLPVKVIILNNQYLGMVRQWQELFYGHNYVATDMKGQPDFVRLAEAYGAEGYRITNAKGLEETLPLALASPNPAVIDVQVEREENVVPMVPGGSALNEMVL